MKPISLKNLLGNKDDFTSAKDIMKSS